MERGKLIEHLRGRRELLQALELIGPEGQRDARKDKKLQEVAGFCEVILAYVRQHLAGESFVRVAEFACGKGYLGIVLALLLRELERKEAELIGVDINETLIDKCRRIARKVGLENASFAVGRTLRFESQQDFHLVVSLHACDTATDEAIAQGIRLGASLIMAVPCCQNQIRGQIKAGHPLTAMTDFGPVRYRLANMLTDVMRAQFLRSAGYYVEMQEIASPRLTPKNLSICARRLKRPSRRARDRDYRLLKSFFGLKPKLEEYCPGIIGEGVR